MALNAPQRKLSKELQVTCLLTEYEQIKEEVRLFHGRFDSMFIIVSVFVVATIGFAMEDKDRGFLFLAVPIFLLMFSNITIAEWYVMASQSARLRAIENRINELNGGIALLEWESKTVVELFVFANIRRQSLQTIRVSPIYRAILFVGFAAFIIICYTLYASISYLLNAAIPMRAAVVTIYVATMALLTISTISHLVAVFRFGARLAQSDS